MTDHVAAGSALGYLYQFRYALLVLCRDGGTGQRNAAQLEVLDDVAFFDGDFTPVELVQTKHHVNSAANLANASVDLWKTLRVWLETPVPGSVNRLLATTSLAAEDSAAAFLGPTGRNVELAVTQLDTVASTSSNRANKPAYDLWRKASTDEKRRLLESVRVIDSSHDIGELRGELERELRYVVAREHVSAFVDYLEGWWMSEAIGQLRGGSGAYLLATSVERKIDELRESFGSDSLPVAHEVANQELTQELENQFGSHVFVSQVKWTRASAKRIANAVRDYLRAYTQRSRWVREQLVMEVELSDYDRRLREAWDVAFLAICDELGPTTTAEVREAAARQVLSWAESVDMPLRRGVVERFVATGSLHMLSDEGSVGWHPDFRTLISPVLYSDAVATAEHGDH